LSQQSVDGESVHIKVFSDLLKRQQLFGHFVARLEFHRSRDERTGTRCY
jgi:hypothetical protein